MLLLGRKQNLAEELIFFLLAQIAETGSSVTEKRPRPGKPGQLALCSRQAKNLQCFSSDSNRREKHVELRAAPRFRRGGLTPSPCSCGRSHGGSGGDHALVPLAVGHGAPVVIGHTALVGLLLASVQEGLHGLTLAFWFAHHVAGTLRPHAVRRRRCVDGL